MSPRPKGSLNKETIAKIEQAIAEGREHEIPEAVFQIYQENYAKQTREVTEDEMEIEITKDEAALDKSERNNQHANPFDDVVQEEEEDDESDPEPIYPDEVYLKMYEHKILTPDEDPYLNLLLLRQRKIPAGKPPVANSIDMSEGQINTTEGDEDHEAAFLEGLGGDTPPWDNDAKPLYNEERTELIKAGVPEDDPRLPGNEKMTPKKATKKAVKKTARQVGEEIADATDTPRPTTKEQVKEWAGSTPGTNGKNELPAYTGVQYGSQGWTQYVLSLLTADERVDDKKNRGGILPKYQGLRRLTEMLIGPIVSTENDIVVSPTKENGGLHAVKARVQILVTNGNHPCHEEVITWEDFGNVFVHSGNAILETNPVTSAYTMALSRCFRNILGLTGVYSSEEMMDKGKPQREHNPDAPRMQELSGDITPKQIQYIQNRCRAVNADPVKVMWEALGCDGDDDDAPRALEELTAREAQDVQKLCSSFQTKAPEQHLLNDD